MSTRLPEKFVNRVKSLLPKDLLQDFESLCTEPLPKTIRLNSKKTNLESIIETEKDWDLRPTGVQEGFFIERSDHSMPLGKTLSHFCGEIYVQTLSSMVPVSILELFKGAKVLDICAAPGSKTTYLSEKLQNTGVIVANDPSSSRSKKLVANLNRMGAYNTVVTQYDGTKLNQIFDQEFDIILLDAPCSSEGYGRKKNTFYTQQWSEHSIHECAHLQRELILNAFEILRPGGMMIYSTCTSAPEENELALYHLVQTYPQAKVLPIDPKDIPHTKGSDPEVLQNFSSEPLDLITLKNIQPKVARLWPHLTNQIWSSEFFFVSAIAKPNGVKDKPPAQKRPNRSYEVLGKKEKAEISVRLSKRFGWERNLFNDKNKALLRKQEEIYLTTPEAADFIKKNACRRAGIKILDQHEQPTTELALHYGMQAKKSLFELPDQNAVERWLKGFDIELNSEAEQNLADSDKCVFILYQSRCLGWAKKQPGKLKNKLDRDLVF